MDINATLIGQLITFTIFVVFTMKYVWPPLTKAMEDRQKTIADGLEAAERGQRELELAQGRSAEVLREAKAQAAEIIEQAKVRAQGIVEESKGQARTEGDRLLILAKTEIEQEKQKAKQELIHQMADIAVSGAEKILKRQIDKAANDRLLDELIAEI